MATITKMQKSELLFSIDYGIVSMEFACMDDHCYKATFVDKNNETWKFTATRDMVLEHVTKFCKDVEPYKTNKALLVAHFHLIAIAWYKKTHVPIEMERELEKQSLT